MCVCAKAGGGRPWDGDHEAQPHRSTASQRVLDLLKQAVCLLFVGKRLAFDAHQSDPGQVDLVDYADLEIDRHIDLFGRPVQPLGLEQEPTEP